MIYLASPYSDPDPMVRKGRYHLALFYTGRRMRKGERIFSPIVYSHYLALNHELPKDFDWWREFDEAMIRACPGFRVLCIPGWQESRGVQAEIALASNLGREIEYIEWSTP